MDLYYFRKEGIRSDLGKKEPLKKEPLKLEGGFNFIFLGGIVGAVLMSGLVSWGSMNVLGVHRAIQDVVRDLILIGMGALSLVFTPRAVREDNEFTWAAIQEVAIIFAGIFMAMIPCLAILKAGEKGAAAALLTAVKEPYHYFWMAGVLSSFLDNAPTYLTFYSSVLGKFYAGLPEPIAIQRLLASHPLYLEAISAGAVFFGANTYIGNAPNFMVRAIAEESGTPMPSFFGYLFKYACPILLPLFVLVTWIFFLH
jgi:Na+/H+ antiporter NhaD/arsenite permease-like protein